MSQTIEQLNGMNKAQVIEFAMTLQLIPTLVPIPAIEGKEQFTNDKGIMVPAILAVPAKSITDQINALPEVVTYLASCNELDKTNEVAKTNFEKSAEFLAGKKTLDILTKFTDENKEKIASVIALNEKFNAENSNTKTPARLKVQITGKIIAEIESIENTYSFAGGSVTCASGYPVITTEGVDYTYEGVLPTLPTFTPIPDATFTSETMVTVPLSFLFSGRKQARKNTPKAEGATLATNATSGDFNESEILRLHSLGKRNSEIMSTLGITSNNKITNFLTKKGLVPNKKA